MLIIVMKKVLIVWPIDV